MTKREAERRKSAMGSAFGYATVVKHSCGSNLVTRRAKGRCCGCGERVSEAAICATPKKEAPVLYRVWVSQVNQTMVEVRAKDEWEAREKGYAKWRREQAHSQVCHVERV